jgi:hypothetical protein
MGRNSCVVGAAAVILLGTSQPATADEVRWSRLVLRVYNYAAVSQEWIRLAREKVRRTYGEAKVDVDWIEPLSRPADTVVPSKSSANIFAVRLLIRPKMVSDRHTTRESVMGVALASDECGGTLSVSYAQVLRVAGQYRQPVPDILALAMAHEVGHLLLPPPSHSATGIMRAEWDGDDIRRAVVGQLTFTTTEASLIRAKLGGCLAVAPAR